MSMQMSPVLASVERSRGSSFTVRSVDLEPLGSAASPVVVLDNFRVNGRPFGPHPHAGFAAVTYVFEESQASLRSRDSLGNDMIVGPGGICWTHAGNGVMHEELPAQAGRELHGLQFFVNLSSKNKLTQPRVLSLEGREVPVWDSAAGDRVRVVVGSFGSLSSPLVPVEPFTLLDVALRTAISFPLPHGQNAIVYVLEGLAMVSIDERMVDLAGEQALALQGGSSVSIRCNDGARLLVLSGAAIHEPIVMHGPFIMNEPAQIEEAMRRFRSGAMGQLEPAPRA